MKFCFKLQKGKRW